MKKILIGIPTIQNFEPFWYSVNEFIVNAKEFYEIDTCIVSDKRLGEAQNIITDRFLKGNYDIFKKRKTSVSILSATAR